MEFLRGFLHFLGVHSDELAGVLLGLHFVGQIAWELESVGGALVGGGGLVAVGERLVDLEGGWDPGAEVKRLVGLMSERIRWHFLIFEVVVQRDRGAEKNGVCFRFPAVDHVGL